MKDKPEIRKRAEELEEKLYGLDVDIETNKPQEIQKEKIMIYIPQVHKHWISTRLRQLGLEEDVRNIQEDIYRIINKSGIMEIGLEGEEEGYIFDNRIYSWTKEMADFGERQGIKEKNGFSPLPDVLKNVKAMQRKFKEAGMPMGPGTPGFDLEVMERVYNEETLLMNLFYDIHIAGKAECNLQGIEKDYNSVESLIRGIDKVQAYKKGNQEKISEIEKLDREACSKRSKDAVDYVVNNKNASETIVVQGQGHLEDIKEYSNEMGLPLITLYPRKVKEFINKNIGEK